MTKARRTASSPQRVVGVGASAGGLDALRQLFARVPTDTGFAFVVLQHLPPSQCGQLAALLATSTAMPVIDIETGHRVERNTVLVVPPHTDAHMHRGALMLRAGKAGARPRLPIDGLFRSLAEVLGDRAIGIVLSGTAHDGTEGLRAIHAAGGLVLVQEPSTAQFDEMPRSAIAAGVAALVLSPARLAEELGAIAKLEPKPGPAKSAQAAPPAIDRVFEQLRAASGIDFASYKRTTIERRLARRLAKLQLGSLDEYSAYLTTHPGEAGTVYEDLLIHVTAFFRDRRVFDTLAAQVFPELIRDKPADAAVRVWVPACSTGEEVYSFAILLLELLGEQGRALQLFGSDLSVRAIEIARQGHYPETIAAQVGAERLRRFFRRDGNGYRINRDVRERCVFVHHDLATDPPFSKLDFVSCRNLLIYLGAALQHRVIPLFHYALNQPGYLLLGSAETIAGFESLFSTVDADARVYARKPAPRAALAFPTVGRIDRAVWRHPDGARSVSDVQREVDHILLARYGPACVLVDDNLDVVQFRGRTGRYLEPPPGAPQLGLLRMARDGLASELPLVLQRARRGDAPVRHEGVVVREQGREHRIDLEVIPLRGLDPARPYFLVIFEEARAIAPSPPRRARGKGPPREQGEIARLSQELAAAREYLHSVVSQHFATTEELGITNEELQSSNEELQSTNEELQTAKEELQSTNEELETVNEELQRSNQLLRSANDDLVNVLAGVEIAIIIVDTERRIRRFTPRAREVMKLLPTDIGRPIADLQPSVTVAGLDAMITGVIDRLEVRESEVRHDDGTSYRMQIRPYRTADHVIDGAVIAFVDITALRGARDRATTIVETVPTPLVVLDERLHVQSANGAFYRAFATTQHDVAGRALLELGEWRPPALRARLEEVVASGLGFQDLEALHRGAAGERILRISASPIPPADDRRSILIGIADDTERRRFEQAREAANQDRAVFLDVVSHELRTPLSAILLWAQALRDLELDGPRRQQAIETILESARSEAEIVDDLLELVQSRSATLGVRLESLDPAPIIQAVVEQARGAAGDKRLVIDAAIAAGRRIDADPRRLKQLTSKLISNAIKFTPPGGRVWVTLAFGDGVVELCVRDTGPGIPPELLARVFEPFLQADGARTRPHGGLGIGLALVRYFVERQGGTIDVASAGDGQGTAFTVRFPSPG
ncbi:MAG TPA: chemotaxis protein CheB [Kofleriaceae bacterium]|nr:chemotaxis protein CheB [Kofleriaceae bacterium]